MVPLEASRDDDIRMNRRIPPRIPRRFARGASGSVRRRFPV